MADNAKPETAPPLKVVPKEDPNADLIALAAGALAKAKEEIRAEVKKEIIGSTLLMGGVLYMLLRGGRGGIGKALRRLTGG
jgi:hypothetical protein